MTQLAPYPLQFFSNDGAPLAGGLLYSYEAGTTSNKDTYSDSGLTIPNTNPVVADSSGRMMVWLGYGAYKLVLTDSLGNVVWTVDNIYTTEKFGNVTNIDELEAIEEGTVAAVYVQSRAVVGDGGQGWFVYDENSTATPDGAIVVIPDTSPSMGRWLRQYDSLIDPRWFGAYNDGTHGAETVTAFTTADNYASGRSLGLIVQSGTYLWNTAISPISPMRFMPNAIIDIDGNDVTVSPEIDPNDFTQHWVVTAAGSKVTYRNACTATPQQFGISDVTTAIQFAVDASTSVVIPRGTYSPVKTIAVSKSDQLIDVKGTFDLTGYAFPAFTLGVNTTGIATAITNTIIRGLKGIGGGAYSNSGVYFKKASYCRIEDCYMTGFLRAIDGDTGTGSEYNAHGTVISKLTSVSNRIAINDANGFLEDSKIEGCIMESGTSGGIITSSNGLSISDNTFKDCNNFTGFYDISIKQGSSVTINSCIFKSTADLPPIGITDNAAVVETAVVITGCITDAVTTFVKNEGSNAVTVVISGLSMVKKALRTIANILLDSTAKSQVIVDGAFACARPNVNGFIAHQADPTAGTLLVSMRKANIEMLNDDSGSGSLVIPIINGSTAAKVIGGVQAKWADSTGSSPVTVAEVVSVTGDSTTNHDKATVKVRTKDPADVSGLTDRVEFGYDMNISGSRKVQIDVGAKAYLGKSESDHLPILSQYGYAQGGNFYTNETLKRGVFISPVGISSFKENGGLTPATDRRDHILVVAGDVFDFDYVHIRKLCDKVTILTGLTTHALSDDEDALVIAENFTTIIIPTATASGRKFRIFSQNRYVNIAQQAGSINGDTQEAVFDAQTSPNTMGVIDFEDVGGSTGWSATYKLRIGHA